MLRILMHEIGQNQRKKGGWAYITSWAYITYSTVHTYRYIHILQMHMYHLCGARSGLPQ